MEKGKGGVGDQETNNVDQLFRILLLKTTYTRLGLICKSD